MIVLSTTTIVLTSVVVFLTVIILLVAILLYVKKKLTPSGSVKIDINDGYLALEAEPGRITSYNVCYTKLLRVILVAAILASVAMALKPKQVRNVEIEKKQSILASVNIVSTAADAEKIYAEKIVNEYVVRNNFV